MRRAAECRRSLPGRLAAPSRRPVGLVRLLQCVLAMVAFSGLAQSMHLVLVRHLSCSHGALVHAAFAPVARHVSAAATAADHKIAGQGAGLVGHEHCRQALVRAAAVTAAHAAQLDRLLAWSPLVGRGRARATRPPVALLHLAPKLSPPRI